MHLGHFCIVLVPLLQKVYITSLIIIFVDLNKDVNWGLLKIIKKMSLYKNSRGIAIWDLQTVASYKRVYREFGVGFIYGEEM